MGDIDLPAPVIKLALKKVNLQLEKAIMMITDEEQVNDLQEEIRKQHEANNYFALVEQPKEEEAEEGKREEAKLNLIISNKLEYFEMLFDLLNLGISEVTTAAWSLLV